MAKGDVLSVPGLSDLLRKKIKGRAGPKAPNSGGGGKAGKTFDRSRVERLVKKAPEVVLTVRRGGKSVNHMQEHLAYISRNGKIAAETEREAHVFGRADVRAVAEDWELAPGPGKPGLSKTINMVLSMPAGTDPEKVRDAARAFARNNLSNHQYMFALHTPETDPHPNPPPHPHVHISVLAYGFDGRRLNPDKAMLQSWREDFATQLRERGVEAEATPRKTRGVVRKATRSAEWHIERRPRTRDDKSVGPKSKAKRKRMEEIADEFRRGERELGPWEQKAQQTQAKVRHHWLELAAFFKETGQSDDVKLATQIVGFVNSMAPVETERMAAKQQMRKVGRDYDARGRNEKSRQNGQEPPKSRGHDRE